jgi:hypothetical protein
MTQLVFLASSLTASQRQYTATSGLPCTLVSAWRFGINWKYSPLSL